MKTSDFYPELVRRNRLLAYGGLAHLLLFFLFLGLSLADQRTVSGINTWIKPMKFAISIWIYLWTLGWYLYYLPDSKRWIRIISTGITVAMFIEIVCITVQAARGVRSHFNVDTPFDGALFSIMGLMILFNTILIIITTILFIVKKPSLPDTYLLGIRLGLILFLFASIVGGMMARQLSHSVGIADGGPGLPFVNWSTQGGDLRIAHFIGLHALQLIPFFAFFMEKKHVKTNKTWTIAFALLYIGLTLFLFWQAMTGKPLIG
jgi:hypothetical protein